MGHILLGFLSCMHNMEGISFFSQACVIHQHHFLPFESNYAALVVGYSSNDMDPRQMQF